MSDDGYSWGADSVDTVKASYVRNLNSLREQEEAGLLSVKDCLKVIERHIEVVCDYVQLTNGLFEQNLKMREELRTQESETSLYEERMAMVKSRVGKLESRSKNCYYSSFVEVFRHKQAEVHAIAEDRGWWDEMKPEAECVALMHSELSEVLESLRKDPVQTDSKLAGSPINPPLLEPEVELADLVIRAMDYAEAYDYRLAEAIVAKSKFNETRPYKHGKKF